jgi:hypothetical protein
VDAAHDRALDREHDRAFDVDDDEAGGRVDDYDPPGDVLDEVLGAVTAALAFVPAWCLVGAALQLAGV